MKFNVDGGNRRAKQHSGSAAVVPKQSALTFTELDGVGRVADFVTRINQLFFQTLMISFFETMQLIHYESSLKISSGAPAGVLKSRFPGATAARRPIVIPSAPAAVSAS